MLDIDNKYIYVYIVVSLNHVKSVNKVKGSLTH